MKSLAYKSREHLGYLTDHPELMTILKTWIENLSFDRGVAYDSPKMEEIECRARDGFYPHSHNRGGFDLEYLSDVRACEGSGMGPNLKEIDKMALAAYEDAKEHFKEQEKESLEGIPDDKINYHDLYDLGLSDLAERLSEIEREYMETPVWWGVRAMYEGRDGAGVHTLCVYAGGNVNEYYGAFGKGSETLGQWELRFKTAASLSRQLKALTKKVEKSF